MKKTVFYSWQSDSPNGTNRSLIENALKDAAKEIAGDESVNIEPVIDRDVQGTAGAVDIAATIFGKIAKADIFVADVSLVLNGKKRSSPNPNVLIELGYALHALGHERIVLVFNEASGKKEKLPFDLKTRLLLTYRAEEGEADRSTTRAALAKDLKAALVAGFSHVPPTKSAPSIIEVIKNNLPSKKIDLRDHLATVFAELDKLQPTMHRDGGTVEQLLAALPLTTPLVVEFTKLCETVVLMDDAESAKEIFQWFGKLLTRYDPEIPGGNGRYSKADGDFFKVIGHELFVTFVSPYVREGKWKALGDLLRGTLRVGTTLHSHRDHQASWTDLSEHSPFLADESKKRHRMSLHADILKDRHTTGELARGLPTKDFVAADLFLALHGEGSRQEYRPEWYPRSILWLSDIPHFMLEAEDYPTAMQICHALKISDVDELKRRLTVAEKWERDGFFPITPADINKIGSTGGAVIVHASS